MAQIKVSVGGESGSGKSTVMAIIEEALLKSGLRVDLEEPLDVEFKPIHRVARAKDPGFAERVAAQGTTILLGEERAERIRT